MFRKLIPFISKFGDDIKIANWVNTLNNIRSVQRILDNLVARVTFYDIYFSVNNMG